MQFVLVLLEYNLEFLWTKFGNLKNVATPSHSKRCHCCFQILGWHAMFICFAMIYFVSIFLLCQLNLVERSSSNETNKPDENHNEEPPSLLSAFKVRSSWAEVPRGIFEKKVKCQTWAYDSIQLTITFQQHQLFLGSKGGRRFDCTVYCIRSLSGFSIACKCNRKNSITLLFECVH